MNSLPAYPELLRTLIGLPSISSTVAQYDSSNRGVCEQLANWLDPLGFRCELLEVPGRPGKLNLIATLGRGDGGLVLAGHADTVPFDAAGWSSDPFAVRETDDRWYGLGTADMKGFLALCVAAAAQLSAKDLKRPLVLIATADEESGMDGAKALVASQRRPGRYAIIGEPTSLRPVRMHKGILMDAVHIRGRAGHSSNPAAGVNAVEGMHAALTEVLAFRDELARRTARPEFPVPHATLNTGCVHGGDSPNRIPASCELQLDLRMLPGEIPATLRAELRERIAQRFRDSPWEVEFKTVFDGTCPFETPASCALVRSCEELTGSESCAVDFATEAGYFNQLELSTVVLGPGDIAQAHQPDEFLPKADAARMGEILAGMIHRFCLAPEAA